MLQLFYRQDSKGSRYLIGRYLISRYLFFSLFSVVFTFGWWLSPIWTAPFMPKPLQVSFIAHTGTFLISFLQTPHVCPVNVCNSEHYLPLNCEQKNAQEEYVVLNGKTELNVFNSEENEIIICQKLASWMLTEKQKKTLECFQEINSNSGFFLSKEDTHRKLFTVKFTGLLNQILFLYVPLPTHPCNAPFLSTAWLE